MQTIAFIDLEASGLGARSWPIEVGWCKLTGEPQSFLIKPVSDWSMDQWDDDAEQLHGIKRAALDVEGEAPKLICQALNASLKDCVVYSDAPDWDGFWLYRLYEACDEKQAFSLSDFRDLFVDTEPKDLGELIARATKTAPHTHRATDDVLHMRALHRLAVQGD